MSGRPVPFAPLARTGFASESLSAPAGIRRPDPPHAASRSVRGRAPPFPPLPGQAVCLYVPIALEDRQRMPPVPWQIFCIYLECTAAVFFGLVLSECQVRGRAAGGRGFGHWAMR